MDQDNSSQGKRVTIGIITGIVLLILTGGLTALAIFMVSILVFGCVQSLPDWLYMIAFFGFPIPLIAASIIVPYLYIKRQRTILIIFAPIAALSLSCLIFFIWFLILTQYC